MPTTNYIWDEQNYLAETDENNVVQTVYTNEPELYGNLISSRISGNTSYHHFDAIGSTRQLTNSVGTATDSMVYDAWGNAVARTGTTPLACLWIGEIGYYYDPEMSLCFIRERTFAPVIARWITLDKLGTPDGVNRYTYVRNLPVSSMDPSGLYTVKYKGGRGVFTTATIHDNSTWSPPLILGKLYRNIVELSDVGSIVSLQWRPYDPHFGDAANPFRTISAPGRCCRCDEVRFVQVIETTVATTYWWSNQNAPWHIDSGIPYPIGAACTPCHPQVHATLYDDPGHPTYRTYAVAQDAEACAVCMSGREGIDTNAPNLYVYGCVKWSHSFTKEAVHDNYKVLRQIGPRFKRGELFDLSATESDIVNVDYIGGTGQGPTAGSAPSARFKAVLSQSTVIPG
jgi:RHS repeat-associated protein